MNYNNIMIWYVCYSIISLKNIHHAWLLLTNVTPRKNITMSWSRSRSRKPALELLYGYIFAPWRDGSPDLIWEEEGDTITINPRVHIHLFHLLPRLGTFLSFIRTLVPPQIPCPTLSNPIKNNIPWQRSSRDIYPRAGVIYPSRLLLVDTLCTNHGRDDIRASIDSVWFAIVYSLNSSRLTHIC